jgi:protein disulfide-isomerase-like protein
MALIVTDDGAAAAEVVVLRDDNFEQMTQASSTGQTTGKWFVQFYASWCGHCKSLSPKWEELSNELEDDDDDKSGSVVIAKLDAVQNPETKERFGVTGFPTLLYFADEKVYKYQGPRTVQALKEFVLEGYKSIEGAPVPPPPPSYVTRQRKRFLQFVEENPHLKMLVDDFEHIVNLRKNAALVLVVFGMLSGILVGFVLGNSNASGKAPKPKSD